jgi:hypothetical protein
MEIDLLEYIASNVSGAFVSDIKACTNCAKRCGMFRCVSKINPGACSLSEWNDAAQYITGAPICFTDREAAKDFILGYLRQTL